MAATKRYRAHLLRAARSSSTSSRTARARSTTRSSSASRRPAASATSPRTPSTTPPRRSRPSNAVAHQRDPPDPRRGRRPSRPAHAHDLTVSIGATVELKDEKGKTSTFTIVGTTETNSLEHKISNESPVGSALVGHREGRRGRGRRAVRQGDAQVRHHGHHPLGRHFLADTASKRGAPCLRSAGAGRPSELTGDDHGRQRRRGSPPGRPRRRRARDAPRPPPGPHRRGREPVPHHLRGHGAAPLELEAQLRRPCEAVRRHRGRGERRRPRPRAAPARARPPSSCSRT